MVVRDVLVSISEIVESWNKGEEDEDENDVGVESVD